MPTFNERRKADREKMAEFFMGHWISAPGFTAERVEPAHLYPGKRCILLKLAAPNGVRLSLEFDGDSPQPNVYVLPWHMATESDTKFAPGFAGDVNNCHFRKATDIAEGFEALRDLLFDRMAKLQRGEALQSAA